MKVLKKYLALVLCLFIANNLIAQERNVIKHNLYGYLNFIKGVKTYGLSYERVTKNNITWAIGGSYGTFKFDETNAVTTGTTERLFLKGFDILPEMRWYPFNREWRSAPFGFFMGPYARLMILEETYERLVSDSFDVIDDERGYIAGFGGTIGYKLGTNPFAFEVLGGLGWGFDDGFIETQKIDPKFERLRREFAIMRLELSVGFVF